MTRDDLLTYDGVTQSILEWSLDYGITPERIMRRLAQGIAVDRAITKPMPTRPGDQLPEPVTGPATLRFEGRTASIREWSDDTGLPINIIRERMRLKWTVAKTLTTPVKPRRGVGSALPNRRGTGGGSVVQERGELEFSSALIV